MNGDIIYEIVKQIYLDGQALIARRLMFCTKNTRDLENTKFEIPVVLETHPTKSFILVARLSKDSVIYWGDGKKDYINGDLLAGINIVHEYKEENSYFIRIFGCKIIRPYWFIKTIHSIGNMDNLSHMFRLTNVTNEIIGKNWDVSNVTSMRSMFSLSHGRV